MIIFDAKVCLLIPLQVVTVQKKWLEPSFVHQQEFMSSFLCSSGIRHLSGSIDPALPRWFVIILAPLPAVLWAPSLPGDLETFLINWASLSQEIHTRTGWENKGYGEGWAKSSWWKNFGKGPSSFFAGLPGVSFSHTELSLSEKIYTPNMITSYHSSTSSNTFFRILKTLALSYILISSRCVWNIPKSPQMLPTQT